MNKEIIMHFAMGFINTPYGWGGQTYGGRQSSNATERTSTKLIGSGSNRRYEALDVPGNNLGDSRVKSSYGIDCSGFVSEAAYLAGITGIPGEGYTAGDLMSAPEAVDVEEFSYLRPGDFVPWSSHVVYVAQAPTGIADTTILKTLEAQPDSLGSELGRTRYSSIRTKRALIEAGAKWRRWN